MTLKALTPGHTIPQGLLAQGPEAIKAGTHNIYYILHIYSVSLTVPLETKDNAPPVCVFVFIMKKLIS